MSETAQRLMEYYPFPDEVVETVADVADSQKNLSWNEFYDKFVLNDPEVVPAEGAPHGIEVLDILPKETKDPAFAVVLHSAMGTCLDPDEVYRVTELSRTLPETRVIAFGQPGYISKQHGTLSAHDAFWVARHGDFAPVIRPRLDYLRRAGVTKAVHAGPSCGSEMATVAADHAEDYEQAVDLCVQIEPVRFKPRTKPHLLVQLVRQFQATGNKLNMYVARTQSQPYVETRAVGSDIGYTANLLRLTNLAIGAGMRVPNLERDIDATLSVHPDAKNYLVWGGRSEFHQYTEKEIDKGRTINALTQRLHTKYPDRFRADCLESEYHAMVNDADLVTALILNGLHWATHNTSDTVELGSPA